jgi:hypothetical protein
MGGYARVATFDVDAGALDQVLGEIRQAGGPPEGVPAKSLTILADRAAGKAVFIVRFDSEADLQQGSETLNAMNPPTDAMRRVSVENYEIVFHESAP